MVGGQAACLSPWARTLGSCMTHCSTLSSRQWAAVRKRLPGGSSEGQSRGWTLNQFLQNIWALPLRSCGSGLGSGPWIAHGGAGGTWLQAPHRGWRARGPAPPRAAPQNGTVSFRGVLGPGFPFQGEPTWTGSSGGGGAESWGSGRALQCPCSSLSQ